MKLKTRAARTGPLRAGLPMAIGPQYRGGDAGTIPDGYSRSIENMLLKANEAVARPPFVYDGVSSIVGLTNFDDRTSKVQRLLAIDSAQRLFMKATSGESWGTAITGLLGSRLLDSANYRGLLYLMMDDGTGKPSKAASFDGVSVSTSPFTSVIASRTVTAAIDRLFLGYPRFTISPLGAGLSDIYDWSDPAWLKTNVTASVITESTGVVTCRLFPTSTAVGGCSVVSKGHLSASTGFGAALPSAVPFKGLWRFDVRAVDAVNRVPITLEWVIIATNHILGLPPDPTAYALGDLRTIGGYLYRCTVAGTTVNPTPAYTTTKGATTVDGTATFLNIGTDVLASSSDIFLENATTQPDWVTYWLPVEVPARPNTVYVSPRLKFYNLTQSSLAVLTPIDISAMDGLADGDPRKKNYGQQITAGDFYYPFFNCEVATSATVDMDSVVWTEAGLPRIIRAANTYSLADAPGFSTAAKAVGSNYVTFKRGAYWSFRFTTNPDDPLAFETFNDGVGCLGPRAIDTLDSDIYFLSEHEVYRLTAGDIQPLAGDAMRDEMFEHGADWVESQSTQNMPLLTIDKHRKLVFVYTQKGKLYVYDILRKTWVTWYVGNDAQIAAIGFNGLNTNNLYCSFGANASWFGVGRSDYTATAVDTLDGSTSLDVTKRIVFKPLEIYGPPRAETFVDTMNFRHGVSIDQTGQALNALFSFDQGMTWPKGITDMELNIVTAGSFGPLPISVCQLTSSLTLALEHIGKAGENAFKLSPAAFADVEYLGVSEYPASRPSGGTPAY